MNTLDTFLDTFEKEKYGINDYSIYLSNHDIEYRYHDLENELYDLASISKLFTLILLYNLNQKKILSFNDSIYKYLPIKALKHYKILDLIKMKGTLKTSKRLRDTKDYQEFIQVLMSVNVIDYKANYNDIAPCLLGFIIEKVTNKTIKENFETLFQELNLKNTKIRPTGYILKGNGNKENMPHDFKTRISYGISGAAGIFSNISDLSILAKKILNDEIWDRNFMNKIFSYNFKDLSNRNRSFIGFHKRTKNTPSFITDYFSKRTLAIQGFTGSLLLLDFKKKCIMIILIDTIKENEEKKQDNFFEGFRLLNTFLSKKVTTFHSHN